MKNILILFFILIYSCSGSKNVYLCGDRKCIDKKEYNDYFAKNLSIEVDIKNKNNRDKSVDLVKLNTEKSLGKEKKFKILDSNENQINIKKKIKNDERKKKLIEKKLKKQILKQRKIDAKKKKLNIKDKIVEDRDKVIKKNNNNAKVQKDLSKINSKMLTNRNKLIDNNICVDINDCDIDKISELLIKEGTSKEFPDITLK